MSIPESKMNVVHEGPSVSTPANEIKFIQTGVKTEKGELQAGIAYGDLQNGRHGTFVRMRLDSRAPCIRTPKTTLRQSLKVWGQTIP
jgi:hypothetical protein